MLNEIDIVEGNLKISIGRFIKRYKHPYARPARYSSTTIFYWDNPNGGRKEYQCGGKFKSYNEFISEMKRRHGDGINIDNSKPYVHYY